MGKIWFRKVAEGGIEGVFKGFESAETLGFERLSSPRSSVTGLRFTLRLILEV